MIEVKGTKTAAPATAADRYVLKNTDKKSKTPVAIGVFLAGLALYLKSIFPTRATSEESEKGGQGEAQPPLVEVASNVPPQEEETDDEDPVGSSADSQSFLVKDASGSPFSLVESPAFDFVAPKGGTNWSDTNPPPSPGRPANDNGPGIGGGGSFGGGGSSDNESSDNNSDGGDDSEDEDDKSDEDTDNKDDSSDDKDDSSEDDTDNNTDDPDEKDDTPDDGDDESGIGNRAPRVSQAVYLADVVGCASMTIALADLLRYASDPDGDELSILNLTISSGTLERSGYDWVFSGNPNSPGPVTISYQITDGEFMVDQVAHFSVVRSVITGTDGNDLLLGTMCADEIDGRAGDDNIDARAGADIVSGGDGDDHIVAGDGNDVVFGGTGDDIIFGGNGNDHLSGGSGHDRIFGDAGDDIIFGNEGDDPLKGGTGEDILSGGDGDDRVHGEHGDDVIEGGDGNDFLFGGEGADLVHGNDGNDRAIATLDDADDSYDGGNGYDTLDYSSATEGILVDLVNGTASGSETGNDRLSGFESFLGGEGDDHFMIGNDSIVVSGGEGNNLFDFSVSEQSPATLFATHEILDFKVGDRIRTSKYDLFKTDPTDSGSQFENIYGDNSGCNESEIRYRHDRADEMGQTVVEINFDNNDLWETTITLPGHHVLAIVENV